jgi:hypothetical protein
MRSMIYGDMLIVKGCNQCTSEGNAVDFAFNLSSCVYHKGATGSPAEDGLALLLINS